MMSYATGRAWKLGVVLLTGLMLIAGMVLAASSLGCAGGGDKVTQTLTEGGAAAAGAAFWGAPGAFIMAGLAHLWNWFAAPVVVTDPQTWGVFAEYGFKLGVFIDRWAFWVGLALVALFIGSPRTRGLLLTWLLSIPKAIAAAARGDVPAVKKQLGLVVTAPAALTPFVGEPVELRMAREIEKEKKRAEREADRQLLQPERRKIKRKGAAT